MQQHLARQQPKKSIMTRWGYLSAASTNGAFALFHLTTFFVKNRAFTESPALDTVLCLLFPVTFAGVAVVAGARWKQMARRGEHWRIAPENLILTPFMLSLLTLVACLMTFIICYANWRAVPLTPMTLFFLLSCPLMWLGVAFGWKHRRERRAIKGTMNELAQTLANVADEKARRETAAQRGTNAPIGGVSRRPSWVHWWTDAGTRDEVEQKQESRRQ